MEVADRGSKKVVKISISSNGALRSAPEWSRDGKLLAFVDAETLHLFEWGKEKPTKAAQLSRGTHKTILSWSPDGSTLAVQHGTFGAYDISLYNVKTKKLVASDLQDLSGPASHLAWSADSKKLLVGTSAPALLDAKGRLVFQAGRDIRVKHSFLDSRPGSPLWSIKGASEGAWPEVGTSVPTPRHESGSFWSLREDQMAVIAPQGAWIAYQVNDRTLALQIKGQSSKEISEPQILDSLQVSGGGRWLLCRRSTTFTAIPVGMSRERIKIMLFGRTRSEG